MGQPHNDFYLLRNFIQIFLSFGFFTQVAIAISHIDDYKALKDSELIFSAAFAAAISILLVTTNFSFNSHFVNIEILYDVS